MSDTKSVFSGQNGAAAKTIVGLLAAGALYGVYVALPFLITLAENTIYLAFLIGVIAALYFIVTSDRVHSLLYYALESVSRAITSVFVENDPVGILLSFVKDLKRKKAKVEEAITNMMGVKTANVNKRKQAAMEMNDFVKKASVAQQNHLDTDLATMTELAGRRQKMITDFDRNIEFCTNSIDALTRVKGVIQYHIVNSQDEADYLKSNYEMAVQMLAATHAANAALGDTDKLDVKNMARDVILDKVAKATGQVDALLESTRSIQGEMDLTKLSFQADGAAKLAELQQQLHSAENNNTPIRATATVIGSGAMQDTPVNSKWADRLKLKSGDNNKL